jgi:hypothetical protein
MPDTITPISKAEMTRRVTRLNQHYAELMDDKLEAMVAKRFTMTDMVALTGWTQEYLIRLDQDGRIPRARRLGKKRTYRWTEDQARAILAFREDQLKKFKNGQNGKR